MEENKGIFKEGLIRIVDKDHNLIKELMCSVEPIYPSCQVGFYYVPDGRVITGEPGKVVTITLKKEDYGR